MGPQHAAKFLDADALVRRSHPRRRAPVDEGGNAPRPPEPGIRSAEPDDRLRGWRRPVRSARSARGDPPSRVRDPTSSPRCRRCRAPRTARRDDVPQWKPPRPWPRRGRFPTGSRRSTSSTHFAGSMLIAAPPRTVPDVHGHPGASPRPRRPRATPRSRRGPPAGPGSPGRRKGSAGAFDSIASRSRTRCAARRFALAPRCG